MSRELFFILSYKYIIITYIINKYKNYIKYIQKVVDKPYKKY